MHTQNPKNKQEDFLLLFIDKCSRILRLGMWSRDNALFSRIEREHHVLLLVLIYAKTSLTHQPQINILIVRQLEMCDWQSVTLYCESPVHSHMVWFF